ncbi:MAG: cytochrome D1 domain-containing protein [Candidatus Promineifilaceae bacterium]
MYRHVLRYWTVLLALLTLVLVTGCRGEKPTAAETAETHTHDDEDEGYDHTHDGEAEENPFADLVQPAAIAAQEAYEQNGVSVVYTVSPYSIAPDGPKELLAGNYADITFTIADASTDEPLTGLRPMAWLSQTSRDVSGKVGCEDKVHSYLQGFLSARPDIDLNGYYILVMNNDATISVLDPLVNVAGMTQLYDMIILNRPGEDWYLDETNGRIFVSMPRANQVAVVDTTHFITNDNLDAGRNPTQLVATPDNRFLLVGNDSRAAEESGLSVIALDTLETVAFVPTGVGRHEIVVSPDGAFVFVTNDEAQTVSVVNTAVWQKQADIPLNAQPAAAAFSAHSGLLYLALSSGEVMAVDMAAESVQLVVQAVGVLDLALTPDGRFGLVSLRDEGRVVIFDTAVNRVLYQIDVPTGPGEMTFSDTAVYIRSHYAAAVTIIPLDDIRKGGELSVSTLPIGLGAPAEVPETAVASAMSRTPDGQAMLFVNPYEKVTYYYIEGSEGTLGSFQAHGRIPRAVTVVNRSLLEKEPGQYTTRFRIPASGNFEAAFFLGTPQVIHCFTFAAQENPAFTNEDDTLPQINLLNESQNLTADEPFMLKIEVTDPQSGEPIEGLIDMYANVTHSSGWNQRIEVRPLANGQYEIPITVPQSGAYFVYFAIPSMALNYDQLPNYVLNATTGDG